MDHDRFRCDVRVGKTTQYYSSVMAYPYEFNLVYQIMWFADDIGNKDSYLVIKHNNYAPDQQNHIRWYEHAYKSRKLARSLQPLRKGA